MSSEQQSILTVITMIKNSNDDILAIKILDAVPSDKLHLVFKDKSQKIQKYRHIYNDILSIKTFKYIDDVVPDINVYSFMTSEKLYKFLKSISINKRLNKEMYLDDIFELLDSKENVDAPFKELFADSISRLNYTFLNNFRRGLLVTTEITDI